MACRCTRVQYIQLGSLWRIDSTGWMNYQDVAIRHNGSVYQIHNSWNGHTQQVTWDAWHARLRGPIGFKLVGGQATAIAIRVATLVEMMNRRTGATSAARTEHGEVVD